MPIISPPSQSFHQRQTQISRRRRRRLQRRTKAVAPRMLTLPMFPPARLPVNPRKMRRSQPQALILPLEMTPRPILYRERILMSPLTVERKGTDLQMLLSNRTVLKAAMLPQKVVARRCRSLTLFGASRSSHWLWKFMIKIHREN